MDLGSKETKDNEAEKKIPSNEEVDEDKDALNALDDFDEKLNLTADEKDDQEDINMGNDFNQEFENLMKEFQNGIGENFDSNPMFNEFFDPKNLRGNNMEDLADNLLGEFLNKEILYEPLKEAKTAYEDYFKEKGDTLPAGEKSNYEKQYSLLMKIVEVLDNEPENKAKLTSLFEEMQENGTPPPIFGDSMPFPFNPMPQQDSGGNTDNCNIQ